MAIPRLGREPISIDEANRIYESAHLLFKRYDDEASMDPSEIGSDLNVNENNFAVKKKRCTHKCSPRQRIRQRPSTQRHDQNRSPQRTFG